MDEPLGVNCKTLICADLKKLYIQIINTLKSSKSSWLKQMKTP